MNALESRKQLLIMESDLNRVQLARDWQVIAGEVCALTEQARTFRSLASAAATLVAGLSSWRRKVSTLPREKLPWWQVLFKSAGVIGSCWAELGTPPK